MSFPPISAHGWRIIFRTYDNPAFLQEHVIILTRGKGCLSENHKRYLQELTSLLNRMAQKLGPHIVQYSPSVTALSL